MHLKQEQNRANVSSFIWSPLKLPILRLSIFEFPSKGEKLLYQLYPTRFPGDERNKRVKIESASETSEVLLYLEI